MSSPTVQADRHSVSLHFALPSPALAPYVTTYYLMETRAPADARIEDRLHPEWGNLRFFQQCDTRGGVGEEPLADLPAFIAAGPTSRATRFSVANDRAWGIGLLPLGWHAFVDADASDHADALCDARRDDAFGAFHSLADGLFGAEPNRAAELSRIEAHLEKLLTRTAKRKDDVARMNAALVDPGIATVADLAESSGLSVRAVERLSRRAFGFSPKLLLRRQRFLRSLAQFMLDPSLSWLGTMDYQYHDQAHFIRDFRRFMLMSPSEYASLDHPILHAAAIARTEAAGEAVQSLHQPPQR